MEKKRDGDKHKKEDKEKLRREIKEQVEQFMENGGKVEYVSSGIINDPNRSGTDRFINHGDSMKSDKDLPGPR